MIYLVLGLSLWIGAHLFKRVLPRQRDAMGKAGRGMVAVLILVGVVLIVIGYRSADYVYLYDLPGWVWYVNNLLMLVAIFLMDAGRTGGVVRSKIRHPMLLGVVVWATAHILVNGDLPSLTMFGTLGLWALVEMVVINRAEGPWAPPAKGAVAKDVRLVFISLIIYAAIVGVHYWLGYSVLAILNE